MKKILKSLILTLFIFILYSNIWNASDGDISFTVSPIKYEIEASTWTIVTKKAMLFNRTDAIITIFTWKSDFEAKDWTWNPRFVRSNILENTGQELSSWINIEQESFEIWPEEEKEITFTINIPDNATPGWHYWAIFFKNNNSSESSEWQIKINVDYWVLILVNIEGEIIVGWEVEETNIVINSWDWSWWGWWYSDLEIDNCPYWDLTTSYYDNKCIDEIDEIISVIINKEPGEDIIDDNEGEVLDNNDENKEEDFNINFETPFNNTWNTHIKPIWKIKLIDEDWNEIKWIWKESILNEDWAIIWEKIVDYLPINDVWWNVLPDTNRNFESEWKWFPYKEYDEDWTQIIKYWSPDEYYTKQNLDNNKFLMPWERLNERICTKNIKAITEISYTDENWEEVMFNSAKDFYVKYKETYVWINPYVIWFAWIILFFFFIIFLICRKKKVKCRKCGKKIDKDMKICPYCWKKQK